MSSNDFFYCDFPITDIEKLVKGIRGTCLVEEHSTPERKGILSFVLLRIVGTG